MWRDAWALGTTPAEVWQAWEPPWRVVLTVGLALWLGGRRDAYALVGILVLEAVVSFGLNQVLGVPRPDAPGVIKYEQVQVGSFSSGHVFLATVLWGLLWARRRIPGALVALAVLVVAVARMYLGVHYLADIVAGALLGLLLVWAYRPLWEWVEPRLARWPAGAWEAVCLLAVGGAVAGWLLGFYGDNPFKWHAGGLVLAGAPALLLEHRLVRYAPALRDAGTRALSVVLALLVLVPLAWVDRAWRTTRTILLAILGVLAALLLLGDFVYKVGEEHARELETVREILAPLAASGVPTFAVLGNHDWGLEDQGRRAEPGGGAGGARDA